MGWTSGEITTGGAGRLQQRRAEPRDRIEKARREMARLVLVDREDRALRLVGEEVLFELPRDALVVHDEVRLVVDGEAADVHVRGADRADRRVDADGLRVKVRALVKQHLDAGARHRSEERRVGKECRSRWSA